LFKHIVMRVTLKLILIASIVLTINGATVDDTQRKIDYFVAKNSKIAKPESHENSVKIMNGKNKKSVDVDIDLQSGAYDPEDDLQSGAYDPEEDLHSGAYDPEEDLKSGAYDPEEDLHSGAYDPEDDLKSGSYDPDAHPYVGGIVDPGADLQVGGMVDPEEDLHTGAYDPEADLQSGSYDPDADLKSGAYDPEADLESGAYDPEIDLLTGGFAVNVNVVDDTADDSRPIQMSFMFLSATSGILMCIMVLILYKKWTNRTNIKKVPPFEPMPIVKTSYYQKLQNLPENQLKEEGADKQKLLNVCNENCNV